MVKSHLNEIYWDFSCDWSSVHGFKFGLELGILLIQ